MTIFRGDIVMQRFLKNFRSWLSKNCATTAIEYTLLAAGIALAIATVVFTLGETVFTDFFTGAADMLTAG